MMIKFFWPRSGKKFNSMLDEPVFICDKCRVLFGVKYLEPYFVMHCPQCGYPTTTPTTMRKQYLGGSWNGEEKTQQQ